MNKPAAGARSRIQLSYQLIRNTTSPDETGTGVKSFVANLSAFEILKVGTKENLRTYIAEYNPRKRNRVHEAIEETIERVPVAIRHAKQRICNSASEADVDDSKKTIR